MQESIVIRNNMPQNKHKLKGLVVQLTILGTAARRPREALLLICAAVAATRILKIEQSKYIKRRGSAAVFGLLTLYDSYTLTPPCRHD